MIKAGRDEKNRAEAAKILLEGRLVAFPTETVYGLGAVASNEEALKKAFLKKGRPTTDPLILHLHSESQLNDLVEEIPQIARRLMASFWPGPLTLIFKKSKKVSPLVTANLETVAVRIPKHEIALDLLLKVGEPVAAPSANKFQSISPTTAEAVQEELGEDLYILDGGMCEKGLESTVVSVVDKVTVLRLGAVPIEDIEMVLGAKIEVHAKNSNETENQVSPGLLNFHYAPKTKLVFCKTVEDARKQLGNLDCALVFDDQQKQSLGAKRVFVLSPQGDIQEAARNLFFKLREVDKMKPTKIVALAAPEKGLGLAINDRLSKAQQR
jgi:L-threonylcarbamoyladenylate synthase